MQTTLDNTLKTAARQIQVGNAATVSSASVFQNTFLCPAANGLLSCDALAVNVTAITTDYYTQGGAPLPQVGGKVDPSLLSFCEGQPSQLMLVTAVYTSPSLVGSLIPGMSTATVNGVKHITTASTAFVNEPWPVTYTPSNGC